MSPTELANASDAQLDALFQQSDTLPLAGLMNGGGLDIDRATRTIFNDAHWKGWVPHDRPINDLFTRLSTGYAKRFWKKGDRYLGETEYLSGRLLVHHELEEVTLEERVNDLDPGQYILLRYTDPVFEQVFYDVMRAISDGVILYRGCTGHFPLGKRGLTGLLMRRFSFAEMGLVEHARLFEIGRDVGRAALEGQWRLKVIDTSNHAMDVADLTCQGASGGPLSMKAKPRAADELLVPPFVYEHFEHDDVSDLEEEMRTVDAGLIVGKWTTDLHGPYAKLLTVGTQGLFHVERLDGKRRFSLYYMLTRA